MSDPYPIPPRPPRTGVERFLGGSPLGVIMRLILLSLVVGFAMSVFGIEPQDVIDGTINLVHDAMRDGLGVFRNLGAYVLTGAVLVVPIWLLIRLTRRH
jgi:uncharacterized oligopeptide transporter (OPT) family protein